MKPKIIVQAEGHVLSIETLRKQCEVVAIDFDSDTGDTHPDDALLLGYLDAAVGFAEDFTGLSIALRTYEIALSTFPQSTTYPRVSEPIELPLPPLVEVVSFMNGEDSDGPVDPETYVVDDYGLIPSLRPIAGWPALNGGINGVKVRYRAGYSSEDSDAQPMPKQIEQALLMLVGFWYANREAVNIGNITSELPFGVQALLRPLRVRVGMA